MRVIAGTYKGRVLEAPSDARTIRPTSDKVRGAIFNSLNSLISIDVDTRVLDLFCGTGALGIEALSRGAGHCTFVDKVRSSLDLARRNVGGLDAQEQSAFLQMDATNIDGVPQGYDLVFLDPPYNHDLVVPTLENLQGHGLINADAVLVIEVEKKFSWSGVVGYDLVNEKPYGDTKILYLRYQAS